MRKSNQNKIRRIIINASASKISTPSGYTFSLSKQFLYLYFYLAIKKINDHLDDGGYVYPEEISVLPCWHHNNAASVGKQIRRHVVEMEKIGKNIIESQQKIAGPFRISILRKHIKIDGSITTLMNILDLRSAKALKGEPETTFYDYVKCMWEGNACFDDGYLKDAVASYEHAKKSASNSKQEIASMQKIARSFERLGSMIKAKNIYNKILNRKDLDELEMSSTYTSLAWLQYQQEHIKDAEDNYNKALDIVRGKKYNRILGSIYNGLGLIRKVRGEHQEALMFYQQALECWSIVDYFYGIQAAYFNIGNLHKIWGDDYGNQNKVSQIYQYRSAIKWMVECITLCEKIGIAHETCLDHILLAELYLKTSNIKKALSFAKVSNKMALSSGNQRDIANSYRILGYTYLEMGIKEKARASFKSGIDYLKKLGVSKIVIKEKEQKIIKLLK